MITTGMHFIRARACSLRVRAVSQVTHVWCFRSLINCHHLQVTHAWRFRSLITNYCSMRPLASGPDDNELR